MKIELKLLEGTKVETAKGAAEALRDVLDAGDIDNNEAYLLIEALAEKLEEYGFEDE